MKKTIDVIIPCYNENENIAKTLQTIESHIQNLDYGFRYIVVDDGSKDDTYNTIIKNMQETREISIIKFSRNFGKESAIFAGLELCDNDAVIILDADLQHPPKVIPRLIEEWERGADVVNAIKKARQKETWIRKFFALYFNRIMTVLSGTDFDGASDFKLLDKKVIVSLKSINEKNRFFRGLTNWVGFQHREVEFDVDERSQGQSKFTFLKLIHLTIDAITSHSSKMLQIITILGVVTYLFSIILGINTLYNKIYGGAVSGFTTVILLMLILSSIIMISIGIMGLYLSKIYNEVKNRPVYIVEKFASNAKKNNSTD